MGSVPFALSIHHFINSVGSDAGFASIIGLAILILLYFAHARETASLRDHAYDAAERIQQLEARIAQLTRGQAAQTTAAPAQAGAPAQAAAQNAPAVSRPTAGAGAPPRPAPAVASAIPSAPAGVAAPALTAATRLIPIPEPAALRAAEPVGAVAAGGSTPGPVGGERVPAAAAVAAPAPATIAGGANGAGHGGATLPPPPARRTPPPRVQLRPQGTIPPSRRPPSGTGGRPPQGRGRSRGRRVLLWLLAALAVGAAVAVVLVLTSSGSHTSSSTNTAASSTAHRHRTVAAFNTSQVTVAVLNGTATPNLAHDIGQQLGGAGYQEGTVATATDQTHPTSIVAYLPGFKRDALAVAGTLKLKPAAVQPVDQASQVVACPPPSTCKANVIVTVGSDLANGH